MAKKDDIVTILLAFLVDKDDEEGVVDINSMIEMANNLVKFSAAYDKFDDYDFPDFSVPSLKKNKYIKRIALNGDLFFKMSFEEAVEIVKNNVDIALAIQYFSTIEQFADKLAGITSGEFIFQPKDPNDTYALYESYSGLVKETSRIFTDGKVTKIGNDDNGDYRCKVEDASYTIVTEEVANKTVYGCVTTNQFEGQFLEELYDDLMCIIKGINKYTETDNKKVYLKRRVFN